MAYARACVSALVQVTTTIALPMRATVWQIRVRPSAAMPMPGTSFGVFVNVTDGSYNAVTGVSVSVQLLRLTETEAADLYNVVNYTTLTLVRARRGAMM
jgi:hypothetical protein